MRRFVLLVAEWVVGVAGLCLLVYGISLMLTAGQLLVGIGCVVGAFILVAQAVVFDHVSSALAAAVRFTVSRWPSISATGSPVFPSMSR